MLVDEITNIRLQEQGSNYEREVGKEVKINPCQGNQTREICLVRLDLGRRLLDSKEGAFVIVFVRNRFTCLLLHLYA